MQILETDVLIVGAGPVGLTAALLLDKMGMSVVIVEQRDGPLRSPAAHVINARTFEVWRQIGLDVDRLLEHAQDPADAGSVHWVTKLGGEVLGSLPFEQQGDDMLAVTPTPLRNLSQHHLEPLLGDELSQRAVSVRYSHQWKSCVQTESAVRSVIAAPEGDLSVTSRWLLACDGASSPVRRSCGIVPEGPHHIQSFITMHITANLRGLLGDHLGVLFWVCDPKSGGNFVSHGIDSEWVYMRSFDPTLETLEDYPPKRCEQLIRDALDDPEIGFGLESVSTWTMTAQVVDRYRDGQIFLVGDAAHRFPPTGGLGLNTGVQDAHNLAWKLNAVLQGTATDSLLDTYESERRPVALRNAEVSLENAVKLIEVPFALGMDDDPDVFSLNMAGVLATQEGRSEVAAAILNQATHFDMLGLQLGFSYGPPAQTEEERDSVRQYAPSSQPGGRLPHGWIQRDSQTCSSLDLIPPSEYVLIAGRTWQGTEIALRVGEHFEDPDDWWGTVLELPDSAALLVRPDQHIDSRWLEYTDQLLTN